MLLLHVHPDPPSSTISGSRGAELAFEVQREDTPLAFTKRASAVLPIAPILVPTLSKKHRWYCDYCWCNCEGVVTERMKERESFLDGQWYRGKVRLQSGKGRLATRKRRAARWDRGRGGRERERESGRVWQGRCGVWWSLQALLKCSRTGWKKQSTDIIRRPVKSDV